MAPPSNPRSLGQDIDKSEGRGSQSACCENDAEPNLLPQYTEILLPTPIFFPLKKLSQLSTRLGLGLWTQVHQLLKLLVFLVKAIFSFYWHLPLKLLAFKQWAAKPKFNNKGNDENVLDLDNGECHKTVNIIKTDKLYIVGGRCCEKKLLPISSLQSKHELSVKKRKGRDALTEVKAEINIIKRQTPISRQKAKRN